MKKYSIFQKHKAKGNMTWYGRIAEDGLFHVQSLGTKKKADAIAWLNLMNAKKFLPEAFAEGKPDIELSKLSLKFMEYVEVANGTSQATLKAYRLRLSYFQDWAKARKKTRLTQITEADAVDFSSKVATNYAPKTAGEIIKLTKAMFDFSARTYKTIGNPFAYIKRPKVHQTEKLFWTPEEIDAILEHAPNAEFRKFWALMAFAGLRYFEAKSLKWKDIASGNLIVTGKGKKLASLPISTRLHRELGAIGNPEETIVKEGTIVENTSSIRVLRRACLAAKLPAEGVNNHRFRHSYASNLIRAGVGVKTVQALMRHESAKLTLDLYSHLLPSDLQKAVETI